MNNLLKTKRSLLDWFRLISVLLLLSVALLYIILYFVVLGPWESLALFLLVMPVLACIFIARIIWVTPIVGGILAILMVVGELFVMVMYRLAIGMGNSFDETIPIILLTLTFIAGVLGIVRGVILLIRRKQ